MGAAACAVGLVGNAGDWIGFAPSRADAYDLVVGRGDVAASWAPAEPDDLLALAIAYFEEALTEPPEDLAATHGDIGDLVRHVAAGAADGVHAADLLEAVDAIDDGLAADVVVSRLVRCLSAPEEPVARLHRRAAELGASVRG
ncbi:MAG TPA: hypothetical protein VFW95_10020 [Candidatus Limnocylindria bacterium]|nr:hypothetical protein [Candidatus Limnocylindria bacterium]